MQRYIVRLLDATGRQLFASHDHQGQAALADVQPWWPNGLGEQSLYRVTADVEESTGDESPLWERSIGFRRIQWRHADAAAQADPWVLEVNGQPVFVQGVNWTPVRPNFADVSPSMIEQRIETYRGLGMNLLRLWGGTTAEHPAFYDACDRLGLLVWQDLPLSSSGIDNWPPEDDATIARYAGIAHDWIDRLGHHACLALWCGGNELQGSLDGGKAGVGLPVDAKHPLIARIKGVFDERDPTRRFVPASASGPRFIADAADFGKNLHWDVHGPWRRPADDYWSNDDALFRSEVGAPGASPAELIRRYSDGLSVMPANEQSPLWARTSWWIQWNDYLGAHAGVPPQSLEQFVDWSQREQAAALVQAVEACKGRFPQCGGIVIWMGHDCFPCTANTSILDFEGRPKPAALALAAALVGVPTSVKSTES